MRKPSEREIRKSVRFLKKGKIVVFPTDTCYGLGVNAENKKAIEKMYKVKNRDSKQPTHILVEDIEMAKKYVRYPRKIEYLAEKFPRGLTLILPVKKNIPSGIKAISLNSEFLGVRIASDPISKKIIKGLGKPVTASSANKNGFETPFTIDDCRKILPANGIFFLDAGSLERKRTSTIVFADEGNKISILREGLVPRFEIEMFYRNL